MKQGGILLLVRFVLALLIVSSGFTLVRMQSQILDKKAELAGFRAQLNTVTLDNDRLTEEIQNVDTTDGIREIARTRLGLVTKGEIVFRDAGR